MDVNQIKEYLIEKEILPVGTEVLKKLQGGTVSQLYTLGNGGKAEFVIKANDPAVIESEASFLEFYKQMDLLPRLLYQDQSNRYIVYLFREGGVQKNLENKRAVLSSAVLNLLNGYQEVPVKKGWGWRDVPVDSWEEFLLLRAEEAYRTMSSHLGRNEYELVVELIRKSPLAKRGDAFLLHGDCGIHNFLIDEGSLSGVIDPTPVVGPPIYDLLYAFCSSPDDLTADTILHCTSLLNPAEQINTCDLFGEVLIILFIRLSTCLKHHPEDFREYEKAWTDWKEKVIGC
ncbi:phosphotransferase [Bacillus sp. AK031]